MFVIIRFSQEHDKEQKPNPSTETVSVTVTMGWRRTGPAWGGTTGPSPHSTRLRGVPLQFGYRLLLPPDRARLRPCRASGVTSERASSARDKKRWGGGSQFGNLPGTLLVTHWSVRSTGTFLCIRIRCKGGEKWTRAEGRPGLKMATLSLCADESHRASVRHI